MLPAGASAPAACALTEHDVREVALSYPPKKIKDFSSTPRWGGLLRRLCIVLSPTSNRVIDYLLPPRGDSFPEPYACTIPTASVLTDDVRQLNLQLSINEPALENAGS